MKQILQICALIGLVLGLMFSMSIQAQTNVNAPTLTVQPSAQAVLFGANATFTVEAIGGGLGYQWQKDGLDLADYGNMAGAQTATLQLVGVSHRDAGDYAVVVSNEAGSVTSAVVALTVSAVVVFQEDFESGSLSNWTAFSTNGDLSLAQARNHTPGGSRSAKVTASAQKVYHNLGTEISGRMKATFWIYDDMDEGTNRFLGEVRGYTGQGHTTYVQRGGLNQSFSIGRYDVNFTTNHGGTLAGETVNLTNYQGRVLRGTNYGWFNLNAPGTPPRSRGWHKFEIERLADGTTVRFKVDGVVGRTITGAHHVAMDCVVIGSVGSGQGLGRAWFDDVKVEAFPKKFDWASKDSAGKGLPDWMKLREVGTNAAVLDISQINTVFEAAGSGAARQLGRWIGENAGIYALDLRGYVEYDVNAPADDAYRIEVEGRERTAIIPVKELPLTISVDGEYLGRFILPYTAQTNGLVRCFTPFLKAGPHTIRIYWDNAEDHISLYLQAVRLQSLAGPDLNSNGLKDWVENRLLNQSTIDTVAEASAVSPVCLEGRGQYLGMMAMLAGEQEPFAAIPIQPGAGRHWYANVPLTPGAPTKVEVSHQNGALQETMEIHWEVTNLLEADDTVIRKGDALLFTAHPSGATSGVVQITVQDVTNYVTDVSIPIVHRFTEAGNFTVKGKFHPTDALGSIKVKVVEASLADAVATWVDKRRYWTTTNLPPQVVLDADPRLKLARVPAPTVLGPDARQYSLTNDTAEVRMVLARLRKQGPVLASAPVQGFRLFNSTDSYLRLMETYADGSQLIETAFILSPVRPEVTVELKILVSGVAFEDGTLSKTLTASDFDELGICRVRFVRAAGVTASVCHATKVYQNGVLIGWPSHPQ